MENKFEPKEIKKHDPGFTPGKVYKLWTSGTGYKLAMGLPAKWVRTDKFINGDHWSDVPAGKKHIATMPRPVLNVCGQIYDYMTSAVKSENVKMVFSPFGAGGAEGPAFGEDIQDLGDLMTKLTEVSWERMKMDSLNARVVGRSAATGIGIAHFYWDKSIRSKNKKAAYIGDVAAECIDALYVVFGNPQELSVQKQPHIIIAGRTTVEEAREMASANGLPPEDIERIGKSEDATADRYAGAAHEDTETPKVNVYTIYWKHNGTIWYAKSTDSVTLVEPKNTKLTKYPIAIFNWKERIDNIYGADLVSPLIPNQKLINGLLAMDAMSKQLTGFPKMFIDTRYVDAKLITNTIGEIIRSKGNMPPGMDPIKYVQPAMQTNAVPNLIETLIEATKNIAGANDAVTGEANTNNASAIMLLQKSSSLPTQDTRNRFYQYIEDIGIILCDFYRTYYTIDRLVQYKKQDGSLGETTFNADLIHDIEFTIRSDVGASSVFSDSNAVSTLDKLVQLQMIDKVTYLKLMPKGVAPFKEELLSIWKLEATIRREMQAEEAQMMQMQPPEGPNPVENMMMQAVEGQEAPPPEGPPEGQRTRIVN